MRRTRRKAKVAWLPLYANGQLGETSTLAYGTAGTLLARSDGQITWEAFPLTFDHQDSAFQAQNNPDGQFITLRDIVEGNAYRLRRICGKAFVGGIPAAPVGENTSWAGIEAAIGFILVRTDSNGDATTDFDEVNPLVQESAEDPWIWQRRWVLGLSQVPSAPQGQFPGVNIAAQFPSTNVNGYGSLSDGPHVDQKTARVISADERLFCVVACRQFSFGDGIVGGQQDGTLAYNVAVRLLGSLRTNVGNRRNASR